MSKRLGGQSRPKLGFIELLRHLHRDIKVTTLDGKLEASLRILNELQGNLRVALLLQIRDNALTNKTRILDDLQRFLVITLDKCHLESVFRGIDIQDLWLGISIETVHVACFHPNKIDSLIEGPNNTVIAIQESVLDVVQS